MIHDSSKKGFTLIELLIVISIVSILASIMLGSQYAIREQISLFQDQYKISDMLNQAKSLTLGAFQRDSSVCGYGVSFQKSSNGVGGTVILYKDKKEAVNTDCNSNQHFHEYNSQAGGGSDEIAKDNNGKDIVLYLNKSEQFDFNGSKIDVVFNAPSLTTFLTRDGTNISDKVLIVLRAIQSGQNVNININQLGQVSIQ